MEDLGDDNELDQLECIEFYLSKRRATESPSQLEQMNSDVTGWVDTERKKKVQRSVIVSGNH
jgi:hypothetical protein